MSCGLRTLYNFKRLCTTERLSDLDQNLLALLTDTIGFGAIKETVSQ